MNKERNKKNNIILFPLKPEDIMRLKPEDICGRVWKRLRYDYDIEKSGNDSYPNDRKT